VTNLDPAFRDRITRIFGNDGRAWLDDLPRIIHHYTERWDLSLDPPLPLAQMYNYVAVARRRDGTQAVFKAGCPDPEAAEIAALRHFDGHGAVRLLETGDNDRVFLMERIMPGATLFDEVEDDETATRVAANVLRRISRQAPPNHSFPTAALWGRAFSKLRDRHGGTTGPLPQASFERGETIYGELCASADESFVLHGDLHHWNILRASREPWLAIDPHGLVGERAFEVGAWMHNPAGNVGDPWESRFIANQTDIRRILDSRLSIFAEELRLDRQRLRDWGIAYATLSAAWSEQSGHVEGWQHALTVADHLAAL
jgi:streptomycin 6-kinase